MLNMTDAELTLSLPSELVAQLSDAGFVRPASTVQSGLPEAFSMGLLIVGSTADLVSLTNIPAAWAAIVSFVRRQSSISGDRYLKARGPGGEATLRLRHELSEEAIVAILQSVWGDDEKDARTP